VERNYAPTGLSARKLAWTILLNTGITAAEFVGGLLTGYLALLADAVHNLSDVAALVLAWLGVKGSELPATKRSTYGYKRLEVMTALISAMALVVIAVFIFIAAYGRLRSPQAISHPGLFVTVAVVGLLGNVFSVWFLSSERGKSLNMRTAFLHMAYDTVSSVAVVIGAVIIQLTGWVVIDAVLSALIGLMILWSSYLVIKEAVWVFLEAVPPGIDFDAVHRAILNVPCVRDVHDLHIWSLSSHEVALSCHVCLNEEDFHRGPGIIEQTSGMLQERFGIGHGTIQIERDVCARPELLCRHDNNQHE